VQIRLPIRTLFYSKPESGVHVTEMMTCDWPMIIVDVFMRCEVFICSVVICLFYLIISARNFNSRRTENEKPLPKNGARKMESIHGAGFWSVCHGPDSNLHIKQAD